MAFLGAAPAGRQGDLISLGIVVIATLYPGLRNLTVARFRTSRGRERNERVYTDNDGAATKESEAAFSRACAAPVFFVNAGAAIGLSAALFHVVYPEPLISEWKAPASWHSTGLWILTAIQAVAFTSELDPRLRYTHASSIALSAIVTATSLVRKGRPSAQDGYSLPWPEVAAALAILFGAICLPRRPVVFYRGHRVDQEHGASVLSRFSFSWSPFHRSGEAQPEKIDLQDVPAVAHSWRVRTLRERFESMGRGASGSPSPLWQRLVRTFWPRLAQQWLLVLLTAVSEFGSRVALHQLLKGLEKSHSGQAGVSPAGPWIWVAGLGLGLLANTVARAWLNWVTQMKLQMPVMALLNALVFDKTTRRQLHHEAASPGEKGKGQPAGPSLTNMLDNETSTVSGFSAHLHHFPTAAFKLLLDISYLAQLIGIKSVALGGISSLVLLPLSTRLSMRHQTLQSELSTTHDALSSLISEALKGLRQIRLSSMELTWKGRILRLRNQELEQIWKTGVSLASLTLVANLGPILLTSVAISAYAFETGHLSPSVAFASLSLFGDLHQVFREVPLKAAQIYDSWVSCTRLQRYFDEPEQRDNSAPHHCIEIEEATLGWPKASTGADIASLPKPSLASFKLSDVNVALPSGKLSIITGKTGSGKSLLVSAIVGEATLLSGHIRKPASAVALVKKDPELIDDWIVSGTTALVSQPPWIENCTVKDNILFGEPLDEMRYRKVLHDCVLEHDLDMLPSRDLTKAGVNGAMLSGGQKWRVALARALYSRAATLVLEDVLSAVDAPVAKWICMHALQGELAEGRTRIIVTHHPDLLLDAASYVVQVQDGTARGTKPDIGARFIGNDPRSKRDLAEPAATQVPSKTEEVKAAATSGKRKPKYTATRSTQQIFSAYLWASGGMKAVILGSLVILGYQFASAGHSRWLANWTANDAGTTGSNNSTMLFNIAVYLALSIGDGIALTLQSLVFCSIGLRASSTLFEGMLSSILGAPLEWIDSTPLGKILHSLGGDMYLLDHRTSPEINNLVGNVMKLVFIVSSTVLSAPQVVFPSLVLLLFYLRVSSWHRSVFRKLQGVVPAAHRPMLDHATSTATGLATIRAFGRTEFYSGRMYDHIDTATKVGWHLALSQKWQDVRLGFLGAVFVTTTAAALVSSQSDPASAGFTITLALQLKTTLGGAFAKIGALRMASNAIDRVLDLAATPAESNEGEDPPEAWPSEGRVVVRDLTVRYGGEETASPPALRGISFSLAPRQRLGIVGRTGAGKTSLTNALLRYIDPLEGSILIDGLDISTLKIARLRSAVALIPQDPFLFSGTLRENLGPQFVKGDQESDDVLRSTLRRVRLIREAGGGDGNGGNDGLADLDMQLSPRGANLSHGQRQLVCMVRAMLARCRVVILDEVTSAVDSATDAAIQAVIRDDFADATILVVAHRLASVAEFDAILVLGDGQVVEFGPPRELMARRGVFWDMVMKSGDSEMIRTMIDGAGRSR